MQLMKCYSCGKLMTIDEVIEYGRKCKICRRTEEITGEI